MATVPELKAELDARGVEYPAKAKKPELEKLVADSAVEEPAETQPDDAPDPPPPPPEPDVVEAKKGELELVEDVLHNGRLVKAGNAVPKDLTDDQRERLERLGVAAPKK